MRALFPILVGAALAMTAACVRDAATHAPSPAAQTNLRPGLWSMTARVDGQGSRRTFCVKPGEQTLEAVVAEGYAANPGCRMQPQASGPGKMEAVFVCTAQDGEVHARFSGDYSSERFNAVSNVTVVGGGQDQSLTIDMTGERIGDACPAE